MRVLHLLAQIPGNTGSGVYLENMLAYFSHRNYPQAAVVGVPAGLECRLPGVAAEHGYAMVFDSPELPFPVPGMSDIMPYRSSRYRDLDEAQLEQLLTAYRATLRRAIGDFAPDLIISHHLWLLTATATEVVAELGCAGSLPVVGLCHGTDLRQKQQLPALAELVRTSLGRLDRVLALNRAQQLEIGDWLGLPAERISVIGNGFNRRIFKPSAEPCWRDSVDFVYAGKLSEAKGVSCLLEAFAALERPEGVELHLHLAGSGQGAEAEALLAQIDALDDATYVGMLPQDRLAELFNRCDIFVLPSFFEGLPLVLAEALSCGLAVVSSELHGVPEWLGEEISASSRFIEVPLPTLEQVDRPAAAERPQFVERLRAAMARSLQHQIDGSHDALPDLTHLAWDGIFYRVEQELRGLLLWPDH